MIDERNGIGMTSQRTRERLVQRLREEGIRDERVLAAMLNIPRHVFIDEALNSRAYEDTALPIGHSQTISQPYIVARMTEALLRGGMPKKVLEIGTGSGYQTAILAALVEQLYSVERVEPLLTQARKRLQQLGYRNFRLRLGDGSAGWPEYAPYDGIIVTAAPAQVPSALLAQLAPFGRLVIPVGGTRVQELLLLTRTQEGISSERLEAVSFVPLIQGEGT